MKGFYMDSDGDIWFGSVPSFREDISESLLLGKDTFRLLYPEARFKDEMFDNLKFVGDKLYPDIDGVDTDLFYQSLWANHKKRWCVSWNKE